MRHEKTKFERIRESYRTYENLHQKHGEGTRDFIRRFQEAYSELEEAGIPLSPYLRAFDLLEKSNLKERDRNMIIVTLDMEGNAEDTYEKITSHLSKIRM